MVESAGDAREQDGFELLDAKEQQKRDSIMNELYNEISSSDDDEDEEEAGSASSTPGSGKSANSDKDAATGKPATADKGAAEDATVSNPFKRRVSQKQASDALKELYGEDYSEPIGLEEGESSQLNLKDKLSAKFSSWFGRAKDKAADEVENPDSKVSAVKRKVSLTQAHLSMPSDDQAFGYRSRPLTKRLRRLPSPRKPKKAPRP